MKQIKTFSRLVTKNYYDDDRINRFLKHHNIIDIKTNVSTEYSDDLSRKIIYPQLITTIIYETKEDQPNE